MNIKNNARVQKSKKDIWKAYLNLVISRSDISSITVSDICKKAGVNRTTFYSHYLDIDDLNSSVYEWMVSEFLKIFSEEAQTGSHSFDFLKLFRNIKENQIFYRIYFKLGFDFRKLFMENGAADIAGMFYDDTRLLDYHIVFFEAGVTAIIKKWLDGGCREDPEDMGQVLVDEYRKKNIF